MRCVNDLSVIVVIVGFVFVVIVVMSEDVVF